LKILFKKCTMAVKAIAVGSGKNIPKTGSKIVPNPKPEKKVSIEANRAVRAITTYIINAVYDM